MRDLFLLSVFFLHVFCEATNHTLEATQAGTVGADYDPCAGKEANDAVFRDPNGDCFFFSSFSCIDEVPVSFAVAESVCASENAVPCNRDVSHIRTYNELPCVDARYRTSNLLYGIDTGKGNARWSDRLDNCKAQDLNDYPCRKQDLAIRSSQVYADGDIGLTICCYTNTNEPTAAPTPPPSVPTPSPPPTTQPPSKSPTGPPTVDPALNPCAGQSSSEAAFVDPNGDCFFFPSFDCEDEPTVEFDVAKAKCAEQNAILCNRDVSQIRRYAELPCVDSRYRTSSLWYGLDAGKTNERFSSRLTNCKGSELNQAPCRKQDLAERKSTNRVPGEEALPVCCYTHLNLPTATPTRSPTSPPVYVPPTASPPPPPGTTTGSPTVPDGTLTNAPTASKDDGDNNGVAIALGVLALAAGLGLLTYFLVARYGCKGCKGCPKTKIYAKV